MNDYNEWEIKVEKNYERNNNFIKKFEIWLNQKGLGKNTIRKHINNANLYINEYLNYYDAYIMEDGINAVYEFFSDWFIRKCLWSSKNSLKETATSIKKFYECMSEIGYINIMDYKRLCLELKKNMNTFLEQMEVYESDNYDDFF